MATQTVTWSIVIMIAILLILVSVHNVIYFPNDLSTIHGTQMNKLAINTNILFNNVWDCTNN